MSQSEPYTRHSILYLQNQWDSGNKDPLEKLIEAFRTIQALDPKNENSFHYIATFHGLPNRYCHHRQVLFPVWHRAYLLRLERALRSVKGCEDVTLPYWDETFLAYSQAGLAFPHPIPTVLTSRDFPPGSRKPNPLFSYILVEELPNQGNSSYPAKYKGYDTKRCPLYGDVSTPEKREESNLHNLILHIDSDNEFLINENVLAWMEAPPSDKVRATSVYSKYLTCQSAENYTVFSNTSSATEYQLLKTSSRTISVESPHNNIHNSIGGCTYDGKQNGHYRHASGDMMDNDFSSLDPIFYLHHAFIDLVFWLWQKEHNCTEPGTLKVISNPKNFPGTFTDRDLPGGIKKGDRLTMNTVLYPFSKPDSAKLDSEPHCTGYDVTNIETQLGYTYSRSSIDPTDREHGERYLSDEDLAQIVCYQYVSGIDQRDFIQSFVVRLKARGPTLQVQEVGNEAILSRSGKEYCKNCLSQPEVSVIFPVTKKLLHSIGSDPESYLSDVTFWVEFQDVDNISRKRTDFRYSNPTIRHVENSRNELEDLRESEH